MFKFVYIHTIKIKKVLDDITNKEAFSITASNNHLFNKCPIEYHTENGICFIYSDKEIDGLELVAENSNVSKSEITKEQLERLEAI